MEYVTLNNGVKMPLLGYGTYQTPARITERCVAEALEAGYRSIDTAQCYGNEKEVGQALRASGIPREKCFVTTKLWGCHGYGDTLKSIEGSLRAVNMDYIDLLLIHEPAGQVHDIYRAMETAYKEGKVRALGVSNFLEERYLDLINHCGVIPAINQVETHVFRQQGRLRRLECQIGTRHESWSPLACGRNGIFGNPTLQGMAEKYRRSIAQIALRFLTQQGVIVIPRSVQGDHMRDNFDSLSFCLEAEDMKLLETLDQGRSLFNWW
ncbi:MAG: aldo/keto reductase [Desulfovibrionaceae bacterium]|nr:aldo/keto reductase [Desulfovibrionaceae bacterium]